MTDQDRSDKINEFYQNQALSKRAPEGPPPTGRCLFCDEILTDTTRRWCGPECRDDWQREVG